MRKFFALGVVLLLCLGCASTMETSQVTSTPSIDESTTPKPLTAIASIKTGMSYAEVKGLMGDTLIVGVQQDEEGLWQKTIVNQPYRRENIRTKDKTLEVLYFVTSIKKADGTISDDELTPLIFDGDSLMAKGWDALLPLRTGSRL